MSDDIDGLKGDKKIIELAKKRFQLAETAEAPIRRKMLAAMKFRLGDQWPGDIADSRKADRLPSLTVNRIPAFIRQVTNDARQNRPAIKVVATDDTTVETAEILEGMARHIQESSDADIAYDTASDHQVTMALGYIRVLTDYVDDTSFDQEIKIGRVKNPFMVYCDPNAVNPDYSDMKWCFIITNFTHEEYKAEYGEDETYHSATEFSSTGDSDMGWMDKDNIRVVEYFVVDESDEKLHLMDDGSVVTDAGDKKPKQTRTRKKRTIKYYKLSCDKVLEENEWPGTYIPIVPVLGEDFDVDGERHLVGMVENMMDSQRMLNYWTSAETQAIALAPKAPWLLAEGQIQGYEKQWAESNIKSQAALVYRPIALGGTPIAPPARIQAEPPVQAMVQAIAQAEQNLKSISGIFDASLGNRSNETSGRAIAQRQKEGDVANFHFIDNQSRAIRHVGRIILDLIPKIYTGPRIARIVHPDKTSEMVKINQPVQKDGMQKIYDVTTGKYDVVIQIGPSFATKRQEAADSMLSMASSYPPLMQIAGDLVVKNLDWPGADEIAERMKIMLPPQLQKAEDGQPQIPPEVQQKLAESGQMVEQLTQALHAAHDKIDSKQAELDSKERIASNSDQTQMLIALIKQESANNLALFKEELRHLQAWQGTLHGSSVAQVEQPMPDPAQQGQPQPQAEML